MFTGREYAEKFKFYEYRARAYNPELGRFMSEDPKGFDAGDYNLYRYVSNDPEDMTDPMGTTPFLPPVKSPFGYEMDRWDDIRRRQITATVRWNPELRVWKDKQLFVRRRDLITGTTSLVPAYGRTDLSLGVDTGDDPEAQFSRATIQLGVDAHLRTTGNPKAIELAAEKESLITLPTHVGGRLTTARALLKARPTNYYANIHRLERHEQNCSKL